MFADLERPLASEDSSDDVIVVFTHEASASVTEEHFIYDISFLLLKPLWKLLL